MRPWKPACLAKQSKSMEVNIDPQGQSDDQGRTAEEINPDEVRLCRDLVSDLFGRSPAVYWTDMLLSAAGAWVLTYVYFTAPAWSVTQIVAFLVAGVLFFRVGTFIHELVHMGPREMPWFKRTWNLLVGIPLLMPWIVYRNHMDHHNPRLFGTPDDGEYIPLAAAPKSEILKYLVQAPLLPTLTIIRFGILGPVSRLSPRLREIVLTRFSAAVSNPYYAKRFPAGDERHLSLVEWLCFAWLATLITLTVAGYIAPIQLGMAYLLLAWALSLNWVRNLAAHGYANRGNEMSHAEQLGDSINITGQTWLTVWLFPVGLRYHALHHLLPSLPYHNMGQAHRRLMARLPDDAVYRQVNRSSFFGAVAELWRGACATSREDSAMPAWRERRTGAQ